MRDVLVFALGAFLGAGVTYLYVREKYRKIAQDEIDEYKKSKEETAEDEKEVEHSGRYPWGVEEEEEEDNSAEEYEYYKDLVEDKYVKDDPKDLKDPYPITEEVFDETLVGYHDKIYLTYFEGDGTLAEGEDIIYEDLDYRIGRKNLELFDHADTIYIRNEKHGADYQIDIKRCSYNDAYPQDE